MWGRSSAARETWCRSSKNSCSRLITTPLASQLPSARCDVDATLLTLSLRSSKSTLYQTFRERCITDLVRICSIIIFHLSKLWKAKFFILWRRAIKTDLEFVISCSNLWFTIEVTTWQKNAFPRCRWDHQFPDSNTNEPETVAAATVRVLAVIVRVVVIITVDRHQTQLRQQRREAKPVTLLAWTSKRKPWTARYGHHGYRCCHQSEPCGSHDKMIRWLNVPKGPKTRRDTIRCFHSSSSSLSPFIPVPDPWCMALIEFLTSATIPFRFFIIRRGFCRLLVSLVPSSSYIPSRQALLISLLSLLSPLPPLYASPPLLPIPLSLPLPPFPSPSSSVSSFYPLSPSPYLSPSSSPPPFLPPPALSHLPPFPSPSASFSSFLSFLPPSLNGPKGTHRRQAYHMLTANLRLARSWSSWRSQYWRTSSSKRGLSVAPKRPT